MQQQQQQQQLWQRFGRHGDESGEKWVATTANQMIFARWRKLLFVCGPLPVWLSHCGIQLWLEAPNVGQRLSVVIVVPTLMVRGRQIQLGISTGYHYWRMLIHLNGSWKQWKWLLQFQVGALMLARQTAASALGNSRFDPIRSFAWTHSSSRPILLGLAAQPFSRSLKWQWMCVCVLCLSVSSNCVSLNGIVYKAANFIRINIYWLKAEFRDSLLGREIELDKWNR